MANLVSDDYIKDTLHQIFDDFKVQIKDNSANIETIRKAFFEFDNKLGRVIDKSNGLDYTNSLIDEYYLIKYTISYAIEYTIMYQIALSQLEDADRVVTYSFGCGSKIDGFSLGCAVEILQNYALFPNIPISYSGIDKVSWPIQFELDKVRVQDLGPVLLQGGNGSGQGQDMVSFMDSIQNMNCNIFSLTKVLGEIKYKDKDIDFTINTFCDKIRHHMFSENKIILCVSYSADYCYSRDDLIDEMMMTQQIIDAFESNGYKCQEPVFPKDILDIHGFGLNFIETIIGVVSKYPLFIIYNLYEKSSSIVRNSALPEYIKIYLDRFRCYVISCIQVMNKEHVAENKDFCSGPQNKVDFSLCFPCDFYRPMENVHSLCFQVFTLLR